MMQITDLSYEDIVEKFYKSFTRRNRKNNNNR